MTGAGPSSNTAGTEEHDILVGGAAADTFVLGDASNAYYQGNGHARIMDFDGAEGDIFRVHGSIGDYSLTHTSASNRTSVFYQNTLIALVENTRNQDDVSLEQDFQFAS